MAAGNHRPNPSPAHPTLLPLDSPERRRLPPLLRRAWYGLNQAFRRRISHTGVTPDQFTVLRTLVENQAADLTQCELSSSMTSDPNTIASLLQRMESAQLIERKPHESDRRALRIRLRPAGKTKYKEIREIALQLQAEVLSVLPENAREDFLEQLCTVADACRLAAETKTGNRPRRRSRIVRLPE